MNWFTRFGKVGMAIGLCVQALIAVRIRPPSRHNIEGFRNWVSQMPETVGVFVVSGSEDFLVHHVPPSSLVVYASQLAHRFPIRKNTT